MSLRLCNKKFSNYDSRREGDSLQTRVVCLSCRLSSPTFRSGAMSPWQRIITHVDMTMLAILAKTCIGLAAFAVVLLPLWGVLLVTKSMSFDIPDDRKVNCGISCFASAVVYAIIGYASFAYIRQLSAKLPGGPRCIRAPESPMPNGFQAHSLRRPASRFYLTGDSRSNLVEMRPLVS